MALRIVPDHPKFAHLKALLGMPKGSTLGQLEGIWHFTGRFTPQGNIGKYNDSAIEAWLEWQGEPGALIAALIKSGWIDRDDVHRLLVHDWHQHADRATRATLKRSKLAFCTPTVLTEGAHVRHMCNTGDENGNTCVTLPGAVTGQLQGSSKNLSAAKNAAGSDPSEETDSEPKPNGPAKKTLLNPELETHLDQIAQNIRTRHPAIRRCAIGEVKEKLRTIARAGPARDRLEILNRVDQKHSEWCAWSEWQKDRGQYAKQLRNWLAPSKPQYWNESPPCAEVEAAEHPRLMM